MEYIDFKRLENESQQMKRSFLSKKPFHYIMFDNFFQPEKAEQILSLYPPTDNETWDGKTYIDQKNKFQKTKFDADSVMDGVFKELNSAEMLDWLRRISDMEEEVIADNELFGGGLHQSINGAFLNVHVDYNIHPVTKFHRRLNLLVYMNKDWKDEYEGHLELWDLTKNQKNLLDRIAPLFNRCVIFETNEISFHGHPKPLKTPAGVSRKSLATYYYTKNRPANEIADEHNTIYVNLEGVSGHVKRFNSGVKAFLERINKK